MWNRLCYTTPGYLVLTLDFPRKTLRMCECQKSTFNPWKDKALAGNPVEQAVSGCPMTTAASSKDRQETVVMQLFCLIHYCILWKYSPLASSKMPSPYLFYFKGGNNCIISCSLFHLRSQQWNIQQEVRKRKPLLTSLLIIFFHWMVLVYLGLAWWLLLSIPILSAHRVAWHGVAGKKTYGQVVPTHWTVTLVNSTAVVS